MEETKLSKLNKIIDNYCVFLEPYKQLLNSHNVQYLVDNHWKLYIETNINLNNDLLMLINNNKNNNNKNLIIKFALNSQDVNDDNCNNVDNLFQIFDSNKSQLIKIINDVKLMKQLWLNDVLSDIEQINELKLNDTNEHIHDLYKNTNNVRYTDRFMNEKKTHEVDHMSFIIAKLCNYLRINQIVDIGSGRGYLSTQLSYIYDLFVIAIDSSSNYVESSKKRLNKMKKQTNLNIDSSVVTSKYRTISEFVSNNVNLHSLIDQRLSISLSKYGLIGLHSCGNLSNSTIMLYLNNNDDNNACLLCNVSCCYHLIDEKYAPNDYRFIDGEAGESGETVCATSDEIKFPLCSNLNKKSYFIGRNARMLSSQPLERLLSNGDINDRGLWYRCVLQLILKERFNLDGVNIKVGKLAPKCENFCVYVRKALNKLKLDNSKINDDEIDTYWNENLKELDKFNFYFQYKILFSQFIEYIILLDRLIYLYETKPNKSNHLIQLFDPVKSPRCHALISF